MTHFDVIIIGAGASGLMCARTAGWRGRRVLVLERNSHAGKKILISGGGRCNFTNLNMEPDCFISDNPHFCKSALKRYTHRDFIAMVEKHGIRIQERQQGQLFCRNSAGDILRMLLAECKQTGVRIQTGCGINSIAANRKENIGPQRFTLSTSKGDFSATSVVVATGGLSMPNLGASGFGYDIARQFGLRVLPTRAGLVPFRFSDSFKAVSERLSGISLEVTLGTAEKTFSGSVLFTHRGLSGPAGLQLSNYWIPGESITMNVLPGVDLARWLRLQKQDHPKALLGNLLAQRLAKRLAHELQALFWQPWADRSVAELPDSTLVNIAEGLAHWQLKPSGTEGYRTAEVTIGGVDTGELSSKTMESKIQRGLYFIGEVVDVTGYLGGFNFQWAWSSGYAAGKFA
ncbi:MAG: NAD(P)/FAD-dependent oxidoreductase [Desulfobacterales bacterium]|nr:NAD(P)/FAD-dependent oxidoreductase [Desulfobacterales bacterium]